MNKHDFKEISENDMLNDSISDVFQSLMLKEQPESNSLQDPVLAQNMFFTVHHYNPFVKSSIIENFNGLLIQHIGVSLGRSSTLTVCVLW